MPDSSSDDEASLAQSAAMMRAMIASATIGIPGNRSLTGRLVLSLLLLDSLVHHR
jgi:hypothetical protein